MSWRRLGLLTSESKKSEIEAVAAICRSPRVSTPAFVISADLLRAATAPILGFCRAAGIELLYSVKALDVVPVLQELSGLGVGFSVGSGRELRGVAAVRECKAPVHFGSPLLRDEDLELVAEKCDYISLNSLSQFRRLSPSLRKVTSVGVRLNPGISNAGDQRFDACRKGSPLGVSPGELLQLLCEIKNGRAESGIGIHVHNNFEAGSFAGLLYSVDRIRGLIEEAAGNVNWVNLGGGFQRRAFEGSPEQTGALVAAVASLRNLGVARVFIEPGHALASHTACYAATVCDRVGSGHSESVVLDGTVFHWPDVFELPFQPALLGNGENGGFLQELVGCSPFAADRFGEYTLGHLAVGERVVFWPAGAYSVVRASSFATGVVPSVYWMRARDGELQRLS